VINRGVPIERIERATGRRAPRLRVATAPSPRGGGVQRDVISIYRPSASRLETVRVGRRNNAGLQQAAPQPNRSEQRSPAARPPAVVPMRDGISSVPILVAPRTKPMARDDNEREFLREQKDLQASETKERRALEAIHRQEMAKRPAKSNAKEVTQRHAAEVQEQGEQRQRAEQQLQTRQQIRRQAAQASEAKDKKPRKPPAADTDKPKKERRGDDEKPPRSF